MGINKLILLISLLFLTVSAQAGYQLNNAESSLAFVSVKKNKIGEVHSFEKLSGGVDDKGIATIDITLTSVKTNIDIRDERMRSLLFETDIFPTATVSAQLDFAQLASIKTGDVVNLSLELMLDLHGRSKLIPTTIQVIGLKNGSLLVSTMKPIMLNAFDFGLGEGVTKLMEVASLPSISAAIPVTFNLVFQQ